MEYSVVIIVMMTGLKLYGIMYPMKAIGKKFNLKKGIINASLAFALCIIFNFHFLISSSIEEINHDSTENNQSVPKENGKMKIKLQICAIIKWFDFYEKFWPYFDALVYSFLPFMFLTLFNILIVFSIRKSNKKNSELRQFGSLLKFSVKKSQNLKSNSMPRKISETIEFMNVGNENSLQRRMGVVEQHKEHSLGIFKAGLKAHKRKNRRLAILIFLVNFSFLFLTLPIVIFQLVIQSKNNTISYSDCNNNENFQTKFKRNNNYVDLLKSIFEILQYLNHSLNFFLYCISGETFRDETKNYFSNILNYLIRFKNIFCRNHFE